jgi:Tfp pilus assembly protein PilF
MEKTKTFREKALSFLMLIGIPVICVGILAHTQTPQMQPASVSVTSDPEMTSRFSRAVELHRAGQLEAAAREYQGILKKNPDVPEVHNNLGLLYQATNQFDLAENAYKLAVELSPHYETAINNYATLLYQRNRYPEALDQWSKLLTINPLNSQVHFHIGLCNYRLGNIQEAQQQMQIVLKLTPGHAGAMNLLSGGATPASVSLAAGQEPSWATPSPVPDSNGMVGQAQQAAPAAQAFHPAVVPPQAPAVPVKIVAPPAPTAAPAQAESHSLPSPFVSEVRHVTVVADKEKPGDKEEVSEPQSKKDSSSLSDEESSNEKARIAEADQSAQKVHNLNLAPGFVSVIYLPEPVSAILAGNPNLLSINHPQDDQAQIFVRLSESFDTGGATNLVITLATGKVVTFFVTFDPAKSMDFVVNVTPFEPFKNQVAFLRK